MNLLFTKLELPESATLIFPIAENLELSTKAKELDEAADGAITRSIEASDFKGKKSKFLSILGVKGAEQIILAGVGETDSDEDREDSQISKELDLQKLGGALASFLNHAKVKSATLVIEDAIGGFAPDFVAANVAYGVKLKSYRFDKYFTKEKDDEKPSLKELSVALNDDTAASAKFDKFEKIAEGVFLTRDVVSEPSNVVYPETYADICKELKSLGVKVEVLGEKEMKKLGMGALLGVGQGSIRESKLVVMEWNGADWKKERPLAFVGKGVTFDTGGISIKPSNGMEEMKYDMAGSGAVVGLMKALAGRKAKVNAIGVIGLAENMPGGNAQRPGDVVTSMSGQTIEVLNTDAEGRLVLADALYYTIEKFDPRFVIDLATLTGAITVCLGCHRAGLFSNDDELSDKLFAAGENTGERLWRFPMGKEYDKQMDSKTADMQNISNTPTGGGSITAAQFLKRFVGETSWAHLDIAGVAWEKKAKDLTPEGASAFGVRLLDRLVADNYEG